MAKGKKNLNHSMKNDKETTRKEENKETLLILQHLWDSGDNTQDF